MSHSMRMEKIQIIILVFIAFGLFALSIPMICAQLIPAAEVSPFEAPGRVVLNVESKGTYIIYREKFLDDDKAEQEADEQAALRLKFHIVPLNNPTADPLVLKSIQNEYVYRSGRRKGISLSSYTIPKEGTYVLRCDYPNGKGPKLRMTIGESSINSAAMRRTIVIIVASVNLGMVLVVIYLVRKMLEK